jgi:hypothetical protein
MSEDQFSSTAAALHLACRSGDLPSITHTYHSDPSRLNEKDPSVFSIQLGWSPLYRTVICGHYEAANFLLEQGADPNICNNLGETPLHQASDNSQYEMADLLLSFKANPNFQQKEGDTPLHHAAFRGDSRMIQLLLNRNADPNTSNLMVLFRQFGRTPLHYAVDCGHLDSVKLMLQAGGDPFIKDKQGKNAFELCSNSLIMEVLKEALDVSRGRGAETSPIGEVTTYVVSDFAENERIPYVFDAFGGSQAAKVSIVSPVAEKSQDSYSLHPIYSWLEKVRLEECYEALIDAGYFNIDTMIRQMNGPLPITERRLKEIGIFKPGHRRYLLVKLEEEAGLASHIREKKVKENNGGCSKCCRSNNGTGTINSFPTLSLWLDELGLGHLHELFVQAGYERYEQMVEIQNSLHPLTSRILDQEVKIGNLEQRMIILRKLQMDLSASNRFEPKISFDGNQKTGCENCVIL